MFGRGGRTGGNETPTLLNVQIWFAYSGVVQEWNRLGYGLVLPNDCQDAGTAWEPTLLVNHVWWADNLWLVGTPVQLPRMIADATRALSRFRMRWKPSSLEILRSDKVTRRWWPSETSPHAPSNL